MRKLILITAVVFIGIIISACLYFTNEDEVIITDTDKASRREVAAVQGVTFLVDGKINATNVSQMTENAKFKKNRYYEYIEKATYTLFSTNKMVIVAQKDTNFHFSEERKPYQTLSEAHLGDLTLKADTSSLNYVLGENEAAMNVTAHIKLNHQTEGDYAGKLKTITKDKTEWAIFIGYNESAYHALSEEQRQEINRVIESFTPSRKKGR